MTRGPGLIGALLVGVSSAKALAAARRLPLVPVDHLHGHVRGQHARRRPDRAAVPVPGGERRPHVPRARGRARLVRGARARRSTTPPARRSTRARGCSGSAIRAGPQIDRLAREGDPEAFDFPRARPGELDFSFSGLKTSLLYRVRDLGEADADRAGPGRLLPARDRGRARRRGRGRRWSARALERLAIGGGVAANSELRERSAVCDELGVAVWVPPIELCTDNAAMIAGAARFLEPIRTRSYLALDAAARLSLSRALLEVQLALHRGRPHLVGDVAAVAHRDQLLALGVEELVHRARM